MRIFNHHIYEYQKGLRRLVLYTAHTDQRPQIEEKLNKLSIAYIIDDVSNEKINIFFGDNICIQVLQSFSSLKVQELNDERDFILGSMLGYDLYAQCRRYLSRRKEEKKPCLQII